jgi:hypothetical protein
MPQENRIKLGENGRNFVLNNFTYKKLAEQYKILF